MKRVSCWSARCVEAIEGGVERLGDRGQITVEQVGIPVERHARRRMTERTLEHLRMRPRLDRQAGVRVPKIMGCEHRREGAVELTRTTCSGREPSVSRRRRSDVLVAFAEKQCVRATVARSVSEVGENVCWHRHGTNLAALGGADHNSPAHEGRRLLDVQSLAERVDITRAKPRQLAPADSGVGKCANDQCLFRVTADVSEQRDLRVGEVRAASARLARKLNACSRVRNQATRTSVACPVDRDDGASGGAGAGARVGGADRCGDCRCDQRASVTR